MAEVERPMKDRNERECRLACFVLPVRDGRVLLARHTYAYSDLWAMVGGMAEGVEAIDAAARREVAEETGLAVSTERLIAVLDREDIMIFVFVGSVLGGDESRHAEEIAELRWFAMDELPNANVLDLVVQLGPFLSTESGLPSVSIAFPDSPRRGFAAVTA